MLSPGRAGSQLLRPGRHQEMLVVSWVSTPQVRSLRHRKSSNLRPRIAGSRCTQGEAHCRKKIGNRPMQVIITDFQSRQDEIRYIRDQVFVIEQQIPREEEFDDRDASCIHAVAYDSPGHPVGTGRLDTEKEGKIGRVAVLQSHRRRGFGRAVMQALERVALDRGLPRVWFHAQVSAVPFYSSLGYRVISDEFDEAGIPHVVMEKRWSSSEGAGQV
ncbi:MAG: GNAT family N-acetyltransferase [Planctomycetota bacterium]|nr:MAG: GNAT family N-acetyltransferase [Planctomycetota bacterium]